MVKEQEPQSHTSFLPHKKGEDARLVEKDLKKSQLGVTSDQLVKESLRNAFNQKKYNSKFGGNNKIKDMNEKSVEAYCSTTPPITKHSEPHEILEFFEGLLTLS